MTKNLYILRGIPGSGKTTKAREIQGKSLPGKVKRVNKDDLRAMIDHGPWNQDKENIIRRVHNELIETFLSEGYDVVVDNTNLPSKTLKKIHNIAKNIGDVNVIEVPCVLSVEECLRRNSLREGTARVPDHVINDMFDMVRKRKCPPLVEKKTYYPPRKITEKYTYDKNEKLPEAVICDLDGTLAIIGNRSPYDASECDKKDSPNWPVVECVKAMVQSGRRVIFLSGRDDKYRQQTQRFIDACVTKSSQEGPVEYGLYMRKTGDQRRDDIVKRELFENNIYGRYNVLFVLDDRNSVVDMWRDLGLSCFQVNYGAF